MLDDVGSQHQFIIIILIFFCGACGTLVLRRAFFYRRDVKASLHKCVLSAYDCLPEQNYSFIQKHKLSCTPADDFR